MCDGTPVLAIYQQPWQEATPTTKRITELERDPNEWGERSVQRFKNKIIIKKNSTFYKILKMILCSD